MIQKYKDWELNESYKDIDTHEKMSHIQKWLTPEQIDWCNYHIKHKAWKVNDKGEVYSPYSLDFLRKGEMEEIPVQLSSSPNKSLNLSSTSLKNLKGCPDSVSTLDLSNCKYLESLEGSPESAEHVIIKNCPMLKTLQGGPICNEWSIDEKIAASLKAEIDLCNNHPDIFDKWIRSDEKLEEFIEKNRGKIHGRKFGL